MSEQPNQKLPKDSAQLVLWFKGLPQPTAFLVLREEADKAVQAFKAGEDVTFLSYPDGRGLRSESIFARADLRGVTFEYPTIQLAMVN
ncbi:hypothetical protein JTY56_gp72 [Xanthomonas phage Bosa]|uniref:Uncharacterized protein n=2 Tax=Bosavirus TaxID=2946834 RepID=A0A679KLM8_9CAUD|nr:hypothetical protein JTY56_gp72 [Xanthomonas phage Bosa]YP_010739207.1 hypothetical protein P9A54_gp75 [Xanthomonas phage vB_Xar_IVIA-DoCa10]ATS92251.1 hypothetical protein [Stenotrophomonas phage DLP4]UYA99060.1 hypothetical protein IVIADoCa10_75 [Xanthomonas phage vB_Xar_IVIA-DoCa10]CAA2409930.1 hypothetical protein [Xanthomonas phage Bosa]